MSDAGSWAMEPDRDLGAGVHLRSAIPGRERWEISALLGRPRLSSLIEQQLLESGEIHSAQANPVTGRLLILYAPAVPSLRIAAILLRILESVLPHVPATPPAPAREEAGEENAGGALRLAGGVALATGTSVLAVRLILGTAVTIPAVIGAGAIATAFTAASLWYRKRQSAEVTAADALAESPAGQAHPLLRLWRYARPHRRRIVAASASSILKKIFDLSPPILVGLALDVVTHGGSRLLAGLGVANVTTQLWLLGGLTIVVFCLESVFELLHKLLWRELAQSIQHELRLDAYAHVQEMHMAALENERTGSLVTTLNDDINELEIFLNDGANSLLELGTNLVVVTTLFAFLMPAVGWLAFLPIPVLLWGSFHYQQRSSPLHAEVQERRGVLSGQLVDNLTGMPTIKSFTAEEHEQERIRRLSEEYRDASRKANLLYSIFEPATRLPILAGFSIVLIAGGTVALQGGLSAGRYALLLFMIQRFLFPFGFLGQTLNNYLKAMSALQEVFDLLETPVGPRSGTEPLVASKVRGEILFDRVHFSYDGVPVLRGFRLHVPAGSTIAIVGSTGAGKTTLAKLLLRFHEIQGGRILIDGHDLRDLRIRDLRRAIGLVSQDIFLFNGTVGENIAYGSPGASPEEIAAAARLAEADSFIQKLPLGYDTPIGERGVKLSGGQRQRLCIARALLKDPPILVLDEATSSVDNETEEAIQRSLRRISAGRTTLIIAHRLSTVRHASCIYVLDGGRVVEQGLHEELVAGNGLYASLWRVQTGEAAPAL